MVSPRVKEYDFIRVFAIFFVFIAHILNTQLSNEYGLLLIRSLSPGLTMSLLGFISAVLLTKSVEPYGEFLVRRFSRIYTSLFVCLTPVLILHTFQGKDVISQHTLLHFFGFSAFFEIFLVKNKATVGSGLWFVTAILTMYILMPLLISIFKHKNNKIHFVIVIVFFTVLQFTTYGMQSFWNVCISFTLGVFLSTNKLLENLQKNGLINSLLISIFIVGLCALATYRILPYSVRGLLFVFYPIGFIPLFFSISNYISERIWKIIFFLSSLSYEFYILHFYLINKNLFELFPRNYELLSMLLISFMITLTLSLFCSRISNYIRKIEIKYLLTQNLK